MHCSLFNKCVEWHRIAAFLLIVFEEFLEKSQYSRISSQKGSESVQTANLRLLRSLSKCKHLSDQLCAMR